MMAVGNSTALKMLAKRNPTSLDWSEKRRENCRPGDTVKLLFRFAKEDTKRKEDQTEALWAKIVDFDEDDVTYVGEIIDSPRHKKAKQGDRLEFHPLHIAEIRKGKTK